MFVFWYCHKRGKEVRLAREAAEGQEGEEDILEVEDSDEDDAEKVEGSDEEAEEAEEPQEDLEKLEKDVDEKADVLNQPDPPEVPLPEQGTEKGAEMEAEKTVGV